MLRRSPLLAIALLVFSFCGSSYAAPCPPSLDGGPRKINVQDATLALRIAAGLTTPTDSQIACYDVAPSPGTEGRLYGDGKISVLDATRLLRAAVGLETDLWPVDNTQLFTLNGGSGFSVPGSATLVDLPKLRAGDVKGAVTLRAFQTGSVPNDLAFAGATGTLVNSTGNSLQFLDSSTWTPQGNPLYLGDDANAAPNPMKVALANGKAYVTLLYANAVAVVDLATHQSLRRIPVGVAPTGIAADGSRVYVTNAGFTWNVETNMGEYQPGTISVIDAATDQVVGTVSAPLNPTVAKIAPDGRLHVVGTGNYADDPGAIAVYDLQPGPLPHLAGTVPLGGSPGSLAFSPSGSAYAGNAAGGLLKYNYRTLQIVRGTDRPIPLQPASEQPEGPTDLTADTRGEIYAALFGKDRVVALDSSTDTVTAEIPVGDGPEALAIR
jgi:YVTN family beta-propeller protein